MITVISTETFSISSVNSIETKYQNICIEIEIAIGACALYWIRFTQKINTFSLGSPNDTSFASYDV